MATAIVTTVNVSAAHLSAASATSGSVFRGVFDEMPEQLLEELERLEFTTNYPSNAVLFGEGQTPRGVFVVLRGKVKLSVSSRDGRTLILRIAEAGEVLGISACVSSQECEATAETLEASEISFLKRADVLRLMQQHNEWALWLAENLSREYSFTCREVRNLMLAESASGKLARFLVENLNKSGSPKQPDRMKLGLTHEQMAQMIGSSRETVTRTLAAFKKRHWIEQNGATFIIHDRSALESMMPA
jgi:CRP/FNR family transcriptional regulator, cyclic AMP receptor protein